MLELEGVAKVYRRGREEVVALAGVDLRVDSGEFVAVMGRSGSGKSTLLHVAGGLDAPNRGRVVCDGTNLASLSAGQRAVLRRRRIGFVFQFFHLLPTLTVAENVGLPLALDGVRNRDTVVAALLDAVGLGHRAGHLPGELSGGEMQRAAIARALVNRPALLLADEPTGNLDSTTAAAVLDLLVDQARSVGAAMVLVTHDPAVARAADRTVEVRDGRIVGAAAVAGRAEAAIGAAGEDQRANQAAVGGA